MIRWLFFRYVVFAALMIPGFAAKGQIAPTGKNPKYIISKRLLSIEDGLASHEVFSGVQDDAGFMWFGTRNGLNRYDGKDCLLFTRQRNNLQDNKVVQLAKDNAGNLFIEYGSTGFQLTTNGKVDVMNTATREVKTLTAAFPKLPFKEQDVYWISNDGTDDINFLTANPFRLWKYSVKKGFTLRYEMSGWTEKDSVGLSQYRSSGPLCMFADGNALLKLSNQSTQYFVRGNSVTAFIQKDILRSLPVGLSDEDDLLIIYNNSTNSNSFQTGELTGEGKIQPNPDWAKYNLNGLAGRYWYQISSAVTGKSCAFYIGNDALYLWHENAFLKIVDKSELKAFENLFLYKLFTDNLGNLWLCTSLGAFQLKIEKNRFKQYFTTAQQTVQGNSQARGIYADRSGKVAANIWTHTFLEQQGKMQYASDLEIKYALVPHGGELYSGGYNLFRYHKQENRLIRMPGGAGSEIWSMFSVNDSLLLLGRTDGLSVFNSRSKTFDSIPYANKNVPAAKFVYRFFKGASDTVWAVAENGLYMLNRGVIQKYQSSSTERLSLLDAYLDTDGVFWLATNGEGLYRWDRKTNAFRQFNIAGGLPSDVLYRIEPDTYGNLWISSDYGLIRFNKKTFSVKTYTTKDGISHNEFNRTSSFRARDGQLFFGGIDGVNALYAKNFVTDTNALHVPLRIIAFNQYVGSEKELINKTTVLLNTLEIRLAPGDQFFTLQFQLLDFSESEVERYAYRIVGVDKDWNYISENSIRISGLPYGEFTLQVKAQNQEGAWSRSELSIPVHVVKPFYLTWWFIALMLLLLVLAIYRFIRFRTKQLAAEKNKLERTVSERTALLKQALSEQAGLLAEKDVLMKEIHHRVKNNLQVISGLLELQSKNLYDETAREALMEGRNRVTSIALIHQNLYQFENLSAIELNRFVKDLCRQVEAVFRKQNHVAAEIEVPTLYLDIDSAVPLGLVMNELLSNSFKYAFNDVSEGRIYLKIDAVAEGRYRLVYSDNGPGLPPDFDLQKSTTLGTQLIADLSRQIGGTVHYENRNGAVYTINFTNRETRKNED